MDFVRFEKILENLGGKYKGAQRCIGGTNQIWKFQEPVDLEQIYLALDAENDSFFQDFEVSTTEALGGNTKVFYKFIEE